MVISHDERYLYRELRLKLDFLSISQIAVIQEQTEMPFEKSYRCDIATMAGHKLPPLLHSDASAVEN